MTPHTQTILADPARNDGHDANGVKGDCFRTAIACLVDLSPLDVPHFVEAEDWWGDAKAWVNDRGDDLIYLPLPIPEDWQKWWAHYRDALEYVILGGPSPRGPFGHVVVGTTDLATAHDPHPSRAGLTDVEEIYVLVPGGA